MHVWNWPHTQEVRASFCKWTGLEPQGQNQAEKHTASELHDPHVSEDQGKCADAAKNIVHRGDPEMCGLCLVSGDYLLEEADAKVADNGGNADNAEEHQRAQRKTLTESLSFARKNSNLFDVDGKEVND